MRFTHIAWNLGGLALPLGMAAIAIPSLIARLGSERFGLLALAWGLIGYAGALDLGLGRALTQMVARLRGESNLDQIPDALFTASRLTAIAGLIGAILITAAVLAGAYEHLNFHSASRDEVKYSLLLLAIALPAQAMSATYKGVNEAFLNFKGINILRAFLGAANFGGPLLMSIFTVQLNWIVLVLVLSRVAALLIYKWLALRCIYPASMPRKASRYSAPVAKQLFSFGSWIVVSSVISPILMQADRFFIASIVSVSAVSFYVLPYELVTQSLILVGAVSSVVFPQLSRVIREEPSVWRQYFIKWFIRVGLLMAFVCAALAIALPMILSHWLKDSLNSQSIYVGQVLCIGVFFNALGVMLYALLHAHGNARVTAKIHLLELPIFLIALYAAISEFGAIGAAYAWVGRMALDTLLLSKAASSTWKSRYEVPV